MPRRYLFLGGLFSSFILILVIGYSFFQRELSHVGGFTGERVIIIDPGHGGEDGGAVAVTGAVESEINLEIALLLEQLLVFYGTEPILLRDEDISLHEDSAKTFAEKKSSDLKQRVAQINGYEQGLLLSIHQNSYTESKYHGAQVFYTENAKDFGEHMQNLLREGLDPSNERVSKLVDPSLYLMNRVEMPALLIECGFLSNEAEAQLLESSLYQKKIACVITAGVLTSEVASNDSNIT